MVFLPKDGKTFVLDGKPEYEGPSHCDDAFNKQRGAYARLKRGTRRSRRRSKTERVSQCTTGAIPGALRAMPLNPAELRQ